MKSSTYKATFVIAAVAIAAVGMLRDPDAAKTDEVGVAHTVGSTPGYQSVANVPKYETLSADNLAKLNAPLTETAPTF
ncbi:hypothetical protein ACI48D_21365 [Massilia sp. LXY-6]|uniref:hypothetical protein n=1 Tax=Massilia sp. LXY-6 TaxID=3379823 RepID=UPI003EE30998